MADGSTGRIGQAAPGAFAGLLLSPWIGFGLVSFDSERMEERGVLLLFFLVAGASTIIGGIFGAVCGSVEIRNPWKTRLKLSLAGAILGCIGGSPLILGPLAGQLLLLTTPIGAFLGLIFGPVVDLVRLEPSLWTPRPPKNVKDRELDA